MAVETKKVEEKKAPPANTATTVDVDPIQVEANNNWDLREALKSVIVNVANEILLAKDDPNQIDKVASQLKARAESYADACLNNTQYAAAYETKTEKTEKADKK